MPVPRAGERSFFGRARRSDPRDHTESGPIDVVDYVQLDARRQEIRVLVVEPGTGGDLVKCRLQSLYLKSLFKPRYETISYVWGDPGLRTTIELNGRKKVVPASSERALRRFRLPHQQRTLWIDAICINQEDIHERASQVALMYKIFSNTRRNLIWLEEESETTGEAWTSLSQIVQYMKLRTKNFKDVTKLLFKDNGGIKASSEEFDMPLSEEAILSFFANPWFTRLWVVQEAALAPVSTCYQGPYEIPLKDILRAAIWIRHVCGYLDVRLSKHEGLDNAVRMHNSADHELGQFSVFSGRISFAGLLIDLQAFDASEPRDHIFGILGLARQFSIVPKSAAPLFKPDYEIALADLYATATKCCIEECEDLSIFTAVSPRSEQDQLSVSPQIPTWAVDLGRKWDPTVDSSRSSFGAFSADLRAKLDCHHLHTAQVQHLILKGIVVDKIRTATETISRALLEGDIVGPQIRRIVESFVAAIGSSLEDLETVCGIAMSLTSGCHRSDRRWGSVADCCDAWTSYMLASRDLKYRTGSNPWSSKVDNDPQDYVDSAYQRAMYVSAANRKLFHTTSGHFGLGPHPLEPGDIVAVLYGCNMPAVLRHSDSGADCYEFIELCYVYGIMDGEAVRMQRAQGLEETIFTLA